MRTLPVTHLTRQTISTGCNSISVSPPLGCRVLLVTAITNTFTNGVCQVGVRYDERCAVHGGQCRFAFVCISAHTLAQTPQLTFVGDDAVGCVHSWWLWQATHTSTMLKSAQSTFSLSFFICRWIELPRFDRFVPCPVHWWSWFSLFRLVFAPKTGKLTDCHWACVSCVSVSVALLFFDCITYSPQLFVNVSLNRYHIRSPRYHSWLDFIYSIKSYNYFRLKRA